MSVKIQAIRGMHDILPEQSCVWRNVENSIVELLTIYGYQEIRFPIVEKTELFARSIGEYTDIVSKEMYTFSDRNEEQLTLRPEGTAGCLRACMENGLLHNQTQKLWYGGPMFRHERPQKGRQRQFHQIGVEAFGFPGPDIDAEMIILCKRLWQKLDLPDVRLEINTLGTAGERKIYRDELVTYLKKHFKNLDEDSKQRLELNPLRVLDSKNPDMQAIILDAPRIENSLGKQSRNHFEGLCHILEQLGIDYAINPCLVRGLDYYSNTVFEWMTDSLGSQGTICAGGRYDKLVEYFTGKDIPAIGFAIGLERLIELFSDNNLIAVSKPHIYLIVAGEGVVVKGLELADTLRQSLKNIRIITHCGGGSFKSQFKKADKSGAEYALILGNNELEQGTVGIKNLRSDEEQYEISQQDLVNKLKNLLSDI